MSVALAEPEIAEAFDADPECVEAAASIAFEDPKPQPPPMPARLRMELAIGASVAKGQIAWIKPIKADPDAERKRAKRHAANKRERQNRKAARRQAR